MIGDIAVLHGKKPSGPEIEEIARFRNPRGVLWIESVNDVTRTPKTEVLWGDVGRVQHRENGYTFILDPRKVMFAQGNRNEKMRLARLVSSSPGTERVADMFAGIGYFSIPLAGAGADVHAMEINPVSFEFLKRTIRENGLSDRITPALGDCRDLLSGYLRPDRHGAFRCNNHAPFGTRARRERERYPPPQHRHGGRADPGVCRRGRFFCDYPGT